jgi:phosphatidylglycerol---prolipoprotein diacylglyceryl transferase
MLSFWSSLPQKINPVAFEIGNFNVLWYSISYLFAFLTVYFFLKMRTKKENTLAIKTFQSQKPIEIIEDLFVYTIIGLFLGAKIGFILFYDFSNFLQNPLKSLSPFSNGTFVGFSGLSFHGATIGIILASIWFCKKKSLNFLAIANFVILAVPLGYFWGRIGNFLNGELYGRTTDSPLGMCFPRAGDCKAGMRHPSQLYEAFGEGIFLFLILWFFYKTTKFGAKILFPLWLIFYGSIRFIIEFFREPDLQIGFILFGLTMGQLLCFCMIIAGFVIIFFKNFKHPAKK